MNLPVKFAGDTPVISLTNFARPGFRIVHRSGGDLQRKLRGNLVEQRAGAGDPPHGGRLFGKVVKNEPTAAPQ